MGHFARLSKHPLGADRQTCCIALSTIFWNIRVIELTTALRQCPLRDEYQTYARYHMGKLHELLRCSGHTYGPSIPRVTAKRINTLPSLLQCPKDSQSTLRWQGQGVPTPAEREDEDAGNGGPMHEIYTLWGKSHA